MYQLWDSGDIKIIQSNVPVLKRLLSSWGDLFGG